VCLPPHTTPGQLSAMCTHVRAHLCCMFACQHQHDLTPATALAQHSQSYHLLSTPQQLACTDLCCCALCSGIPTYAGLQLRRMRLARARLLMALSSPRPMAPRLLLALPSPLAPSARGWPPPPPPRGPCVQQRVAVHC
jgi:hypothetical protein